MASSILIAGLLIGGAIITQSAVETEPTKVVPRSPQQAAPAQDRGTQAPSCGV